MKPSELLRQATESLIDPHIIDDPSIRERSERDWGMFEGDVATLLDVVQQIPADLRRTNGIEFDELIDEHKNGNCMDKIVKRYVKFSVNTSGEYDRYLTTEGTYFKRVIIIGTHDLYSRLLDDPNYGQPNAAYSCDILTTLELEVDDMAAALVSQKDENALDEFYDSLKNPFEGFQVLERTNWLYPVFNSYGSLGQLEATREILAPMVSGEAYIRADAVAMQENTSERLLAGMRASLDDLRRFLKQKALDNIRDIQETPF